VCAICERQLIVESRTGDREALVGQECHIVSTARDGPRHGPAPGGGYDGQHNLLLLCAACHVMVDALPQEYSAKRLIRIKLTHEQRVRSRVLAGTVPRVVVGPIHRTEDLRLVASGEQLLSLILDADDLTSISTSTRSERTETHSLTR
jgi:hypothetical protein